MRAVVQRVSRASVTVDNVVVGTIDRGMLVVFGVTHADTDAAADYLADKIAGLRIFEDDAGKMNLSLVDVGGAVLAVSQFTLTAMCAKESGRHLMIPRGRSRRASYMSISSS